jgi:hypothetical protein
VAESARISSRMLRMSSRMLAISAACCLARRICSPFPRACPAFPSADGPSGGRGSRGRCQPSDDPIRSPAAAGGS